MKLYQPNATYIHQIETGNHYLNCPKHMFNETLHQLTRGQGYLSVLSFLMGIHYPQAKKVAQEVYDNFTGVSPQQLRDNNPNPYMDLPLSALPAIVQSTDAKLNQEWEQSKHKWTWWDWALGIKFDSRIHR